MGATLEALQALQHIGLQIFDIRQQLARKINAVRFQERKLAELQRTSQEQHDQLQAIQMEADAMDLDLKSRAAHVARLRAQLNSAKTNKEYAAVLQELNTQKADETHAEGGVMVKLEETDKQKAACADIQEQIEETQTLLAEAERQHERARKSLADRMAALTKQRDEAVAALEPSVARIFDRTSERYEGEALARIIRTHPRRDEFICDGCNMTINLERFNAVMTREDVQTCASCGRILYVGVDD